MNHQSSAKILGFLLVSISTVACSEVKSSAVTTEGIYIDYAVVTEGAGSGSEANTTLRVGGVTSTTFVDLEAGDQLVVSVNEESQVLSQSSLGVIHSYDAAFTADAEGDSFVLAFDRADVDGAPETTAVLPAPFELTEPAADGVVSRSDDVGELVVAWDNQGDDRMKIMVEGDCFVSYLASDQSDSGTHIIPLSYFKDNEYDSTTSCEATVIVERQRAGSVDPAFAGGQALGIQKRSVSIRLDP